MDKHALTAFMQASVPVSGPALDAMLAHFSPRNLRKHDFFLQAGYVNNDYFFLEAGCLRAFTLDPAGNEVTTYFYTPERVVFECASFFMRLPSTESIQALTDCRGYSITYDHLNALFHSVPEGREFGRKMLVREFVAFKRRTLALINQSAEARYRQLIETDATLFQHAQLRHIASYLGITDTSLSRIRRAAWKR